MKKQDILKVFLLLTVALGLVMLVNLGTSMTVSMFIVFDVLPVGLLCIVATGVMYALKNRAPKEKTPPPAAKKSKQSKQSAMELFEIEKIKADQQQQLSHEIAMRTKSGEKKNTMDAALEGLKNKKKAAKS